MTASEVLSAFVDGEPVETNALSAALAEPGSRELLIDFVRLRAALNDDSRPTDAFAEQMRARLDRPAQARVSRLLRLAAALVVLALAGVGVLDLARGVRPGPSADEPPTPTRVIRFEPGVDWKPAEGR